MTARIKALIAKGETLQKLSEADPVAPIEGLTQAEMLVLAVLAGSSFLPSGSVAAYSAKNDAERAGLTNVGFNIGIRRLTTKGLVEVIDLFDEQSGEPYQGLRVTENGWKWVDDNEGLFVVHRPTRKRANEIPF